MALGTRTTRNNGSKDDEDEGHFDQENKDDATYIEDMMG
jgi:hypothetical protein